MNTFGHKVPVRNEETGEVVGERPSVVSRVTRGELDGSFGVDKYRALIVSLKDGDVITMRPSGRTQKASVSMTAFDLYRYMVRSQAQAIERRARAIQKANGGRMASALKQARKEFGQ